MVFHSFSFGGYCHAYLTVDLPMYVALTCPPVFQLNISFPATGCQKLIEVDDERKLRTFYEKRMATEVAADPLGDEWKVRCFIISLNPLCKTKQKEALSRPFPTGP